MARSDVRSDPRADRLNGARIRIRLLRFGVQWSQVGIRSGHGAQLGGGAMETLLVPGAHLELAPVFLGVALVLAIGLRLAARRRRSRRHAR
jgi:hypothetical protein